MASRNILINSNFESAGPWRLVNSPTGFVSGAGRNGGNCVRFDNKTTGNDQFIYQAVNLVKSSSYTLGCYCKASGNSMILSAVLRYAKAGGDGVLWGPALCYSPKTDYTYGSWTFTMPSDALGTIAHIEIHAGGAANTTATMWVDDIELVGNDAATTNPTIPYYSALPSGVSDRVWNGTFDYINQWTLASGISHWNQGGSNIGTSGGYIEFTNRTSGGSMLAYQNVTCVPGSSYKLSLRVKRIGRMDIWCNVSFYVNGVQTSIGTPSLLNRTFEVFTRHDVDVNLPQNCSNIKVNIWGGGNAGDSATAYVDDVRLLGPDPATYPTGLRMFEVAHTSGIRTYKWGDRGAGYQHIFPSGRKFCAVYMNQDAVEFRSPDKNDALLECDTQYLNDLGPANANEELRVEEIVKAEVSHVRGDFTGSGTGSWCQTFVNWCARLAQCDDSLGVYSDSNCGGAKTKLGSRYWNYTGGSYIGIKRCWVYYRYVDPTTGDFTSPTTTADHVGYIKSVSGSGKDAILSTIEGNRETEDGVYPATRVNEFSVPIQWSAGKKVKVTGFAYPPYMEEPAG